MTTYPDACAWAKAGHGDGIVGHCLKNVADAFDAPHGVPDAYSSWIKAGGNAGRFTHTTPGLILPRNVPVYWSGGPHGYGHVAISDGNGYIWTTDKPKHGKFTRVKLDSIAKDWGLRYLGWSEVLNGMRVHDRVTFNGKGWS